MELLHTSRMRAYKVFETVEVICLFCSLVTKVIVVFHSTSRCVMYSVFGQNIDCTLQLFNST